MPPAGGACEILIVDDNADIVDMVRLILESSGYIIRTAANGAEALSELRRAGPARLILLDMMMPVMNGWQFRSEQLRDPTLANIPIVVLTGDGTAREKAAEIGAVAYLKKPVELKLLMDTLALYC